MTLLQMIGLIRTVLGRENADVTGCINLLERFKKLNLTPLMLLKNPSCVETIKKLRRYIGNTKQWGYSPEDTDKFNEDAARIRILAREIYDNLKVRSAFSSSFVALIQICVVSPETLQHARERALLFGLQ